MPKNYSFACLGDSITSDEVTGIGTLVCKKLGAELIGNFAHGNATMSDWHDGSRKLTKLNLNVQPDEWGSDNTLSNQIAKLLQTTTLKNVRISWQHPICGESSLDGICGRADKSVAPDIVYIAIGINDGKLGDYSRVIDNCDEVFKQDYMSLDKNSMASSLRWAIETLRSAYPDTLIFVASPLQTNTDYEPNAFSYDIVLKKREIIKKVCDYCSVYFIDLYARSGFSNMLAKYYGDGVHPNAIYKNRIANYIVHTIRNEMYLVNEEK